MALINVSNIYHKAIMYNLAFFSGSENLYAKLAGEKIKRFRKSEQQLFYDTGNVTYL
jgi:hypothetical protein